jgi:hypothetical protein
LWQKIFGSPTPPPPAPVVQSVGHDLAESAKFDPTREPRDLFSDSDSTSTVKETGRRDRVDDATETADLGDDTTGENKRPRSRRRRGGRGRKSSERAEGRPTEARRSSGRRPNPDMLESPGADDFDDLIDDDEEDALVPASEDESPLDHDHADDDDDGELSDDATPGRVRAGHRSIPSWDEAIGMIVETNMQSRSQRRPSNGPGGQGQRGRPRGGRRRRKPS